MAGARMWWCTDVTGLAIPHRVRLGVAVGGGLLASATLIAIAAAGPGSGEQAVTAEPVRVRLAGPVAPGWPPLTAVLPPVTGGVAGSSVSLTGTGGASAARTGAPTGAGTTTTARDPFLAPRRPSEASQIPTGQDRSGQVPTGQVPTGQTAPPPGGRDPFAPLATAPREPAGAAGPVGPLAPTAAAPPAPDAATPGATTPGATTSGTPSDPGAPAAGVADAPALRRGDDGPEVRALQRQLADRGWRLAVDGVFGPQTDLVVRTFQRRRGLLADGIVGSRTRSVLSRP